MNLCINGGSVIKTNATHALILMRFGMPLSLSVGPYVGRIHKHIPYMHDNTQYTIQPLSLSGELCVLLYISVAENARRVRLSAAKLDSAIVHVYMFASGV